MSSEVLTPVPSVSRLLELRGTTENVVQVFPVWVVSLDSFDRRPVRRDPVPTSVGGGRGPKGTSVGTLLIVPPSRTEDMGVLVVGVLWSGYSALGREVSVQVFAGPRGSSTRAGNVHPKQRPCNSKGDEDKRTSVGVRTGVKKEDFSTNSSHSSSEIPTCKVFTRLTTTRVPSSSVASDVGQTWLSWSVVT